MYVGLHFQCTSNVQFHVNPTNSKPMNENGLISLFFLRVCFLHLRWYNHWFVLAFMHDPVSINTKQKDLWTLSNKDNSYWYTWAEQALTLAEWHGDACGNFRVLTCWKSESHPLYSSHADFPPTLCFDILYLLPSICSKIFNEYLLCTRQSTKYQKWKVKSKKSGHLETAWWWRQTFQ